MVETREALIASGATSAAIAGTYLIANQAIFPGQEGAIAITLFSSSFALSYLGMKNYLPF